MGKSGEVASQPDSAGVQTRSATKKRAAGPNTEDLAAKAAARTKKSKAKKGLNYEIPAQDVAAETNKGQGVERNEEVPGEMAGTGFDQPVRPDDNISHVRPPPHQSPPPSETEPVRQHDNMPSSSEARGGIDLSAVARSMEVFLHTYAENLKASNKASLEVALSPLIAIQAGTR